MILQVCKAFSFSERTESRISYLDPLQQWTKIDHAPVPPLLAFLTDLRNRLNQSLSQLLHSDLGIRKTKYVPSNEWYSH